MTLRSAEFDDVYFSAEDGLAETRHTFLDGNDLPAAWAGKTHFTIAETGFGTGLNFLAAWLMFDETAQANQRLDYIAVERYPLTPAQIGAALARWDGAFGGRLQKMLAAWPLPVPGFHRLALDKRTTLTLIFDDVMDALPQIVAPAGVDAWFLDGFAPKKNPQMWTPEVFAQMARLSHAETTYATFTAKGVVRRALAAAGFTAVRTKGYGTKWHMTRGRFIAAALRPASGAVPQRVAIIGGGLAGTAAAFMLRRAGIAATIFESGDALAPAASGNAIGLVNPRLSARRTAQSDYYVAGFAAATRLLPALNVGWDPCGSLHFATDDDRARQLRGAAAHWGWPETQLRYLDSSETAEIAGLPPGSLTMQEALWLPTAGTVSPTRLCRALAGDADIRLDISAVPQARDGDWRIGEEFFTALILAGGAHGRDLLSGLPLRPVRGQLTQIATPPALANLRCALCYGGYVAPAQNERQWIGATFQRGETDTALRTADNAANLAKLEAALPGLGAPPVLDARAGVRVTTPDHFPVVGQVEDSASPLYVTAAHGSHGIVSSLAAGQLLADIISGRPYSLPAATSAALSPARFAAR